MSSSPGSPAANGDATPELMATERAWAERSEQRWRRAHAVAGRFPQLDVSDIYHALRCLELTPSQRLAAGLQRGRLRPHAR